LCGGEAVHRSEYTYVCCVGVDVMVII
jgi:hypothetical protein